MKTLADLKRNAINYTWEMYYNSGFGGYLKPGDKFYGLRRKVLKVQSNSLSLQSPLDINKPSWLEWPKATELTITDKISAGGQEKIAGHNEFIVLIEPIDPKGCAIFYHLRPVVKESES